MKFVTTHTGRVRPHLVKDEKLKKFWDDLADDWLALEDQKPPNEAPTEKTSPELGNQWLIFPLRDAVVLKPPP
jgi:hypothetical protein